MKLWGVEKGTAQKALKLSEEGACVVITQQSLVNWPYFKTTLINLETGERFTDRKMVKLRTFAGKEYWCDAKTGTLYHAESGRNAGGSPLTIAGKPVEAGTIRAVDGPKYSG